MKKVLVTTRLLPEGFSELEKYFEVISPEKDIFAKEYVLHIISGYDALLPTFQFKVTKDVIDAATNLRIIANYGVGYNNIDVEYATKKGIVVTNTPEPATEPTAEMAMALIYACARRIAECDRKIRTNTLKWGVLENLGTGLFGKQLGIIGMGRIGQSLARRAMASGMSIVYFNRNRLMPQDEMRLNVQFKPFEELLKTSDFISINTPLTADTQHLIASSQFEMMKQSAILINTARGAIVHEQALVNALRKGKIRGAGLDVYEFEPQITEELLLLDNVVLAPHNGTATIDARNEMSRYAGRNIIEFFNGNYDISIVNREALILRK